MKIRAVALVFAALLTPLFAQQPPTPGPQHQKLAAKVGTWNAALEMTGEDGKPMQSKGVSVITAVGAFWVVDDFKADLGGMPFHGHGATGYDPAKGKYVGTWVDSMSTMVLAMEGDYDKAGKVLTMTGMAPGPDGKPVLHTFVTTHVDADKDVFEMFVPGPDGKPFKVMTITYTRAAGGKGGTPGGK